MTVLGPHLTPAQAAGVAERAVLDRSVRRLWGLPGTALGVPGSPPVPIERLLLRWNHWWQSHLLDTVQDAQARDPRPARARLLGRLYRTMLWRTPGLLNSYYDDLGWFALAVQRHGALPGGGQIVRRIGGRLLAARHPTLGGVRWRVGDEFANAPATGPAALLLARAGAVEVAGELLDWLHDRLGRPDGLLADGVRPDGRVEDVWTYNQGVVLGVELELARRGHPRSGDRIGPLVVAVEERLSDAGVLRGHGGGDGGLFTPILTRYLALVAVDLPSWAPDATETRDRCRRLVLGTAEALRNGAATDRRNRPLFSPEPGQPAVVPGPDLVPGGLGSPSSPPESDLSTQLGGWMVLEAAARIADAAL